MTTLLVETNLSVNSDEEIIRLLTKKLHTAGLVEAGYAEAAVLREKEFPTGLPVKGLGVAIPHADPALVRAPCLCVGKLARPVSFGQMGAPDKRVAVELVILMGVTKAEAQLTAIGKIVELISDARTVEALLACNDSARLEALFKPCAQS